LNEGAESTDIVFRGGGDVVAQGSEVFGCAPESRNPVEWPFRMGRISVCDQVLTR
jgi:hypothetical protein